MISVADSGIESGSSPEMAIMEFGSHHGLQSQPPMSRTHQYRKVMKPLLERKRRARINRCLDELKDIMVGALQAEGESISKLEKADVLELTVKHLRKLKRQNALGLTPEATYVGKFRAGYTHCAHEVSKFVTGNSGIDLQVSTRLIAHLGSNIRSLETLPPSALANTCPPRVSTPESGLAFNFASTFFPGLIRPAPMKPIGPYYGALPLASPKIPANCDLDDKAWRPW
ncbi:hypothetical protein TCAL_08339 [Tigriopus californicus]|uniref:BHLH domain-containing protein n=1 Tax=Tigriopus californicus TaxID=6832 RepID=A0A553PNC5_TIGCA|nr:enhancer of split mbeta protein-like [Tigriopus californicus]TRY79160.1 hypothetical protein TCAL_08339 [Tigriopus californicus]|eukprot:TCALIF_08339-PA protein Name:"Similar to HLHmbeta Enhancer of split mbeta protein (Drosophila melanogaster)" AED:0.01 eAED:0.01 QI:0/-1/0/1/-1/1/1/0/227